MKDLEDIIVKSSVMGSESKSVSKVHTFLRKFSKMILALCLNISLEHCITGVYVSVVIIRNLYRRSGYSCVV